MVLKDLRDIQALMDQLDSLDRLHRPGQLVVLAPREFPVGQLARVPRGQRAEQGPLEQQDRLAPDTLDQLDSLASLDSRDPLVVPDSLDRQASLVQLDLPASRDRLADSPDGLDSLDPLDALDLLGGLGQLEPDSRVQPV